MLAEICMAQGWGPQRPAGAQPVPTAVAGEGLSFPFYPCLVLSRPPLSHWVISLVEGALGHGSVKHYQILHKALRGHQGVQEGGLVGKLIGPVES